MFMNHPKMDRRHKKGPYKPKTRRHTYLAKTKFVLHHDKHGIIPVFTHVNTSSSVVGSPAKPRLLKSGMEILTILR